jgi:ribosomal protein L37E
MQTKTFQKNKEDFICENCGQKNVGDGYTNHCFKCLYSKHVDINPGDREEKCKGLMEPIEIFNKSSQDFIKHKCLKCGFEKNNKVSKKDSFDEIIKISNKNKI